MKIEKSISCHCEGVGNAPLILKAQSDACLKLAKQRGNCSYAKLTYLQMINEGSELTKSILLA